MIIKTSNHHINLKNISYNLTKIIIIFCFNDNNNKHWNIFFTYSYYENEMIFKILKIWLLLFRFSCNHRIHYIFPLLVSNPL